jgi:hypothetical protein
MRPYAWAAPLLDYGTLVALPALPGVGRDLWATSRVNLLEEYVGRRGVTTFRLRLYRRGVCILRWDVRRPRGVMMLSRVGSWERDAGTLVVRLGESRAVFGPLTGGWCLSHPFPQVQQSPELLLEGVELRRV